MAKTETPPSVRVENLTLPEAEHHRSHWQDLCDHASEANCFYTPSFVLASSRHLFTRNPPDILMVWLDRPDGTGKLIGLLPFTRPKMKWSLPSWRFSGWWTNYLVSTAPVLRRGFEDESARAIITWLDGPGQKYYAGFFRDMPLDGTAYRALRRALSGAGRDIAVTRQWQRALLENSSSAPDYIAQNISGKTRQNLKRKKRQLSKYGKLTFESHDAGSDISGYIEEFLKLEAQGWKGRGGTAMNNHAGSRAFARELFNSCEGKTSTHIDILRLDGKPISITTFLICGDTGFYYKPAYDETYGRYSPGILAQLEKIESVLDKRLLARIDSACIAGHRLEGIWRERRNMGDILFLTARGYKIFGSRGLGALSALEKLRWHTLSAMKAVHRRLRSN